MRCCPSAAKRLLALAAGLIASLAFLPGSGTAWAQADPFELPVGVNVDTVSRAGTPGLSEIVVDGRRKPRMAFLEWTAGGELTIEADDARVAGIDVPSGASGKIPLAKLPVAKWNFDGQRQTLFVDLLRKSDGANLIDLGIRQATDGESGSLTWAKLNYDLIGSVDTSGRRSAGGLFEAAAGRGNFLVTTSFAMRSDVAGPAVVQRLDTTAQLYMPGKAMIMAVGDVITDVTGSQRAFRIGGFKIASDYSLRPDLITTPLPMLTGRVSVPTAIDLIANGQTSQVGKVEPGEFTIRNVPMPAGRGEAAVVVRDVLGRETVQNIRFYSTPELLAPGIRQFSANIGFVRRRYAEPNDTYGELAATGFYRRGISQSVTGTVSVEATRTLANAGARFDVALGGLVLASIEARASSGKAGGSGAMINAALETGGAGFTGRVAAAWPTSRYRDVAAALGDPLPMRSVTVQTGYTGARASFQLAAGHAWRLPDPRYPQLAKKTDFVNLSTRYEVRDGVSINGALAYQTDTRRTLAASIGLSIRLGKRNWGGLSATQRTGYKPFAAATYRQMATDQKPLGYVVTVEESQRPRVTAMTNFRARATDLQLQGEFQDGTGALRLNARGSLILAGGKVFPRASGDGTFALVRAGRVGGLTVKHNHQFAGHTDKHGRILIGAVIPAVAADYEIDPDKLPNDVVARVFQRRLVIPRRTVGLVRLDAILFVPRPVRLQDGQGKPLESGSMVVARPSGDRLIVGFDGFVETNGAGHDRILEAPRDDGTVCRYSLPPPISAPVAEDPQVLACSIGAATPTVPLIAAGRGHRAGAEFRHSRR
ncbi:MAG: fimbrial biogenesis outer membrane usher protein [Proteobacteria bacterium]|nr:fimbrial biogenesis outer membrane usher protein [Pseudomonadota bacterium]